MVGVGDEEGPRDLLGRQPSEQAERERDPGLGGEHRMTGREHEAQEIVAHVVVDRGVEVRHGHLLPGLELVADLLVLAFEPLGPAKVIDRPVLRGGHEPGARIVRDARLRPSLERGHERVLGQVLGDADVAHDPGQPGDEPGRLDPPYRVDRDGGCREPSRLPITPPSPPGARLSRGRRPASVTAWRSPPIAGPSAPAPRPRW